MQVNRTGYIVIGVVALLVICSSRHTASDAETKSKLAQVDSLAAAGSFEDAATLIESIDERLFPDTVILLRKGIIYRQLDDVESRRKSVHFFRRLVDRYPTNPRFFLELARTLLAQAFDYEAESQLRRAIELNPTDEIPYLLLYDIYAPSYFFNGWETEANQAESTLQAFLRQVPSSRNGLCKLASLEAVRGRLSLALEHTQRALAIDSAAVDVSLIMAYIQYRMRNYELCQHYFDKALAGMTHFQRWAYTTVECVLPPQVAAEYPNWRPAVRDSVGRDFWRTRDSDPTTEINERLLEHYSRVWEANLSYGTPENGGIGWRTVMGATLVRMGRPDERTQRTRAVHSSYRGHFVDYSHVSYWGYSSTEFPCSFAFLDRYLNNRFAYPDPGYDNGLPPLYQESRRLAEAIFSQKPEQSSLLRFRHPVNIGAETYQFRGATGRTVALVHLTIPYRDIAFDTAGERAKATLAVRKALRTPDQEMIWHKAEDEKLDLSIGEARRGSGSWMDLFTVEAKAGVYQLAVACEQPQANHFGLSKNSVKLQSYDSTVALSDLLLTEASITDPKLGDIWKGENSDKVFPQRTLPLSKPLTVYFEIYNLPTDIYAQTSVQISYSLRMIRPNESGLKRLLTKLTQDKRESITITYRESGKSRDLVRATVLDVSRLRAGDYMLTIQLTDLIFNRTVAKTTTLTLTP